MKRSISIIFLSTIAALSARANPGDTSASGAMSVIDTYTQAFLHTDPTGMRKALDKDAVMQIPRFDQVITQTKQELVSDAEASRGINQSCTASKVILSRSSSIVIAKVTFAYREFNEDVFLLVEFHDRRWAITRIIKMFPPDPEAAPATSPAVTTR